MLVIVIQVEGDGVGLTGMGWESSVDVTASHTGFSRVGIAGPTIIIFAAIHARPACGRCLGPTAGNPVPLPVTLGTGDPVSRASTLWLWTRFHFVQIDQSWVWLLSVSQSFDTVSVVVVCASVFTFTA